MLKRVLSILVSAVIMLSMFAFCSGITAFAAENIVVTSSDGEKSKSFAVSSADATDGMKKAFEYCTANAKSDNPYIIKMPKGSFVLKKPLVASNYTTLDLTAGTTLISDTTAGAHTTLYNQKGIGGYEALSSFAICGGTFKYIDGNKALCVMMRFAHCKNITFEGVTFVNNYNSHIVEVAASKNVVFSKCTFTSSGELPSKSGVEQLQLDVLDESKHFINMPPYDGTMNNGITVKNCVFKNVSKGVGTRNIVAHKYQSNIKITNNTFENLTSTAIVLSGQINCTVTGNKIKNCGEGIYYYMMHDDALLGKVLVFDGKGAINTSCGTEISGNTITLKRTKLAPYGSGIFIKGNNVTKEKNNSAYKTGDYYVGGIKIKSNTITTPDFGIRVYDTKKSEISSNKITAGGSAKQGIFLAEKSDSNTVSSNTITGAFENAINLRKSSKNTVKSNTVTSPLRFGIILQEASKSNTIQSNTFKSCGETGIALNGSNCAKISSNKISSCKNQGISFTNSSSATSIESNKISNILQNAVAFSGKSSAENISSNTVEAPKKSGFCIIDGSSVETLSSNTVNASGSNAVYLDAKSSVGTMSKNTLSASAGNGVYCLGKIKKASSNTLKSNAKYGMAFAKGASGEIFKNTYTSNKNGDLYVADSTVTKLSNLETPKLTVSNKDKKITAKWGSVKNAVKYQVYTASSKDGKYTKAVETAKTSCTLQSPGKGKTCFVKVRAMRTMGGVKLYSSYSAVGSVRQ